MMITKGKRQNHNFFDLDRASPLPPATHCPPHATSPIPYAMMYHRQIQEISTFDPVMAPRGSSWQRDEMLHLLEVIEKILPLNPEDWDKVKYHFDKRYAANNRSVNAITNRFQSLYRTKEPTGSPNIPEEVRVAKQIRTMIIEKSDGTTGSYHPDEEFEYDDTDEYFEGDVVDDNDANNVVDDNDANNVDTGLLREDDEEEEVSINANVGRAGSAFHPHGPRPSPPSATTAAAAPRGTTPSSRSLSGGGRTPTPTPIMLSSRFANQLQGMRSQSSQQRYNKPGDGSNGFSFQNMMGMMMMQQQNDREERMQQAQLDREIRAQQAEQMRLEREERAEQQRAEREERAEQNRQMSQFMMMMMASVMGRGKKRGRDSDDDDDNSTLSPGKRRG